MGLDMYAYTAPAEMVGDKQTDHNELIFKDGHAVAGVDRDFAYWRKFNNLHQWMESLYYRKGGERTSFNCVTVRLMPDDLDRLEAEASKLSPGSGFFWGDENEMTQGDIDEVNTFIKRSREAIAEGKAVLYDSWW